MFLPTILKVRTVLLSVPLFQLVSPSPFTPLTLPSKVLIVDIQQYSTTSLQTGSETSPTRTCKRALVGKPYWLWWWTQSWSRFSSIWFTEKTSMESTVLPTMCSISLSLMRSWVFYWRLLTFRSSWTGCQNGTQIGSATSGTQTKFSWIRIVNICHSKLGLSMLQQSSPFCILASSLLCNRSSYCSLDWDCCSVYLQQKWFWLEWAKFLWIVMKKLIYPWWKLLIWALCSSRLVAFAGLTSTLCQCLIMVWVFS